MAIPHESILLGPQRTFLLPVEWSTNWCWHRDVHHFVSDHQDVAVNWGNFANLKTISACKKYAMFRQIMLVAAQVIVCCVSDPSNHCFEVTDDPYLVICFLRTYALYGRSRRVAILILSISGGLFIVSCVSQPTTQSRLRYPKPILVVFGRTTFRI